MKSAIRAELSTTLLHLLQNTPYSVDAAVAQAREEQGDSELPAAVLDAELEDVANCVRRRLVLNPVWLAKRQLGFHFYLVDAQQGSLQSLFEHVGKSTNVSRFTLYGRWDALVVLVGTAVEAEELENQLGSDRRYGVEAFSAKKVLRLRRHQPATTDVAKDVDRVELINALVAKCDTADADGTVRDLVNSGIAIGTTWDIESEDPMVGAFIGIETHRSRTSNLGEALHERLMQHPSIGPYLVDLYETDRGLPFHYVARIACRNRDELDRATDAIGFSRINGTTIEGTTLVVARSIDQLPSLRPREFISLTSAVDLAGIEELSESVMSGLWPTAAAELSQRDPHLRLLILTSLDQLNLQLVGRTWDEERDQAIRGAVRAFARASLQHEARLDEAVLPLATVIEAYQKEALKSLGIRTYGDGGVARLSQELRTGDIRRLTLGKFGDVYRRARDHSDFTGLRDALDDRSLEMLDLFATLRNTWSHGSAQDWDLSQRIMEARRVLSLAIDVVRWVSNTLLSAAPPLPGPTISLPERDEASSHAFISHSHKDAEAAARVATAARALNSNVFYSGWSINPGDSIVEKINADLAKHDIFMILLSPGSVASRWVKKELDVALMRQLRGEDVLVLPLLIEQCQIPPALLDVEYIDMTKDFEGGLLRMLDALVTWSRRHIA